MHKKPLFKAPGSLSTNHAKLDLRDMTQKLQLSGKKSRDEQQVFFL